jgi:large subunit ribosomal protein L21
VYAIVQCGGHQVKMIPGATIVVDKVDGEKGVEVSFDQVLMVEKDGGELMAGAPFLAGARVVAVVDGVARGPKIRVVKKKRRKGMRRTKGHRSTYTRVTVKDIVL